MKPQRLVMLHDLFHLVLAHPLVFAEGAHQGEPLLRERLCIDFEAKNLVLFMPITIIILAYDHH